MMIDGSCGVAQPASGWCKHHRIVSFFYTRVSSAFCRTPDGTFRPFHAHRVFGVECVLALSHISTFLSVNAMALHSTCSATQISGQIYFAPDIFFGSAHTAVLLK